MMPCIKEGWLYCILCSLREAGVAAAVVFAIFMLSMLG